MKPLLLFFATLLLIGCASENEQKGLDKIAELYNAKTSYSKDLSSSAGKKTIRQFNVKVSESKLIDSLQPTVTSANIALLVFENMSKEEKNKYTAIDVELVNSKKDTAGYTYPIKVLEGLSPKAKTFRTFSESIVNGNFNTIESIKNKKHIPQAIAKGLKINIESKEKKYGKVKNYQPFGIAEMKDEFGTIIQFQGFFNFSNGKKTPYLVVIDQVPGKDEMIGFRLFE